MEILTGATWKLGARDDLWNPFPFFELRCTAFSLFEKPLQNSVFVQARTITCARPCQNPGLQTGLGSALCIPSVTTRYTASSAGASHPPGLSIPCLCNSLDHINGCDKSFCLLLLTDFVHLRRTLGMPTNSQLDGLLPLDRMELCDCYGKYECDEQTRA